MKILKMIIVFIFLSFSLVAINMTRNVTEKQILNLAQYEPIKNINIDVTNTNINITAAQTDQISIEQKMPKYIDDSVEFVVDVTDNTLKISNPIDSNHALSFQSQLNIIIPESLNLDKVDLSVTRGNVAISSIQTDDFIVSGSAINMQLSQSNMKAFTGDAPKMNLKVTDSNFVTTNFKTNYGSLDVENSKITTKLETEIAHGDTTISNSLVADTSFSGNQVLYLTLSNLYNTTIKTQKTISDPMFTEVADGYVFGSQEQEAQTMIINALDSEIRKIK